MHGFDRNTTCACASTPVTGEQTLTCTDSACLYYNHEGTVCSTNSYGYRLDVWGQPGAYFDGFQYLQEEGGRQEKLIMEYQGDESCRVLIDGEECSTCEQILCVHETRGHLFKDIRANCQNIEDGVIFDGCDTIHIDTGVFEAASANEFGTCIFPRSPEDVCHDQAVVEESQKDGVVCECKVNALGAVDMMCVEEGCLYCSADRMVCGHDTFGTRFNRLGRPMHTFNGFKFISGREGFLTFQMETDPGMTRDCVVSYHGLKCSQCSIAQCDNGNAGLAVDCTNLEDGALLDQCNFERGDGSFLDCFSPLDFLHCIDVSDLHEDGMQHIDSVTLSNEGHMIEGRTFVHLLLGVTMLLCYW